MLKETQMKIRSLLLITAAAPLLIAFSTAARAEDAEESAIKVSGNFGIYSDYRFRGVSLNDKKFTPQGGFTVSLQPGFYVGAWGSPANDFVGGTEIDVSGGFTNSFGPLTYDVGVVGYIYPKASDLTYYEVYGSFSGALGPVTPKVGFYWAPKQTAVGLGSIDGKKHNFYVYGGFSAGIPDTPFSVNAQLGYESGGFDYSAGSKGKVDWTIGGSVALYGLTLSANYIDSNAPVVPSAFNGKDLAKGTVVVALSYAF
jgi:uncharacterized protein (TIGR02001 family)